MAVYDVGSSYFDHLRIMLPRRNVPTYSLMLSSSLTRSPGFDLRRQLALRVFRCSIVVLPVTVHERTSPTYR